MSIITFGIVLFLTPIVMLCLTCLIGRQDHRQKLLVLVFVIPVHILWSCLLLLCYKVRSDLNDNSSIFSISSTYIYVNIFLSLVTCGVIIFARWKFRRSKSSIRHPRYKAFHTLCYVCLITGFFVALWFPSTFPAFPDDDNMSFALKAIDSIRKISNLITLPLALIALVYTLKWTLQTIMSHVWKNR